MPAIVTCAVLRDDTPPVLLADDQDALDWEMALQLIARVPGSELSKDLRDQLCDALRDELRGVVAEPSLRSRLEVEGCSSFELYSAQYLEHAFLERSFTPLSGD